MVFGVFTVGFYFFSNVLRACVWREATVNVQTGVFPQERPYCDALCAFGRFSIVERFW